MSSGYFLSSFSKAGQALGLREFCVPQSQDMMGMVIPDLILGEFGKIHFHSVWHPWLGRDTEKEE